jgi:DNA-binding beta-propeller fold protein YncE
VPHPRARATAVCGLLIVLAVSIGRHAAVAGRSGSDTVAGVELPTGKSITPTAARGAILQDLNPGHPAAPDVRADGPASLAVSPDGKLLAILASGYNRFSDTDGKFPPELSTEFLFLLDITGAQPRQLQVFPVRASFEGLSWAPSSNQLFASGGVDDLVAEFVRSGSSFVAGRTFQLGHTSWVGPDLKELAKIGIANCPGCTGEVGGLAVNPDGTRLLVANVMNDSVSLIDTTSGRIIVEQDLRPGIVDPAHRGQAGGSYPRAVAWASPSRAYVVSERDRELISIDVLRDTIRVVRRMSVQGQPIALLVNRNGSRIYVALDTTNHVAVFDTASDRLVESFDAVAPERIYANTKMFGGANTNALALTSDERILLVSNGGENAIAVVRLSELARGSAADNGKAPGRDEVGDGAGPEGSRVVALVPTGWYPSGVATSKNGSSWYIVNGKSPTGPNASWCRGVDPDRKICVAKSPDMYNGTWLSSENQHIEQLEKASLLTVPAPTPLELARLTKQVVRNNGLDQPQKTAADEKLFSFLRAHIKHVIYVMKENRTYDQVLGDLEVGNGDRRFTLFPEAISPNHHAIARNFVDLDNTLVSGEGSPQGWTWTYAAQTTDYNERNEPHIYANRGVLDDSYGNNRTINMGYATSQERRAESPLSPSDPDILPGVHDVNAPDGPGGLEGKGYIWDAALERGLAVRNWGLAPSEFSSASLIWDLSNQPPLVHDPYGQKQTVFWTSKASLRSRSDPYFYTFDPAYPDYWRVREWKREFDGFAAANSAPNLMLMWLANDHFGNYDRAIDGVSTPETQMADNDYAFGLIVEAVANSPFAKDTLILSIEDDAWDGADHVEAHRTVALVAGAYVRHHAVVSTRYTTVSVVETIEEILGFGPIGLNDALAAPMSDVFDPNAANWTYKAIVPEVLYSTKLPLPPPDHAVNAVPRHSASYWTKAMAGQDFSGPDRINPVTFNRALWRGLKGDEPYRLLRKGRSGGQTVRWRRRSNRSTVVEGIKETRPMRMPD